MKKYVVAIASFILPLSLYTFSLCPSVHVGDSGEFITAAYTLGVTHPPSSPPWCLLTKVFTYLPVSSIAWRVNFSSAFYAATAAFFVFLFLYALTRHLTVSLLSALLFAVLKTNWMYAVLAKNYTLVSLWAALFFWLLERWDKTQESLYLYLSGFILGTGITTHYLLLPLVVPWFFFMLYKRTRQKIRFSWLLAISCFLSGLLFFSYTFFRARANPPINCGNAQNLTNFIYTITRLQFGRQGDMCIGICLPIKKAGVFTAGRIIAAFYAQQKILIHQFGIPFFLMGISGAFLFFKRNRVIFNLTFISLLCSLFVFQWLADYPTNYLRNTVFTQHIPAFIIFCLWIGYFIFVMQERLKKFPIMRYCLWLFLVLNISYLAYSNYPDCNKRGCFIAYDYGMNILNSCEKNSLLICEGSDIMGILAYLQICEKQRPDILLIDRLNNLLAHYYTYLPQMIFQDVEVTRLQTELPLIRSQNRPVYYTFDSERYSLELPEITLGQIGLVYKATVDNNPLRVEEGIWDNYRMRGINNPRFYTDYSTAKLISEYYWHKGNFFEKQNKPDRALEYFRRASIINNGVVESISYVLALKYLDLLKPGESIGELEKSIRVNQKSIRLFFLLGSVYMQMNQLNKAIETFVLLTKIQPLAEAYEKLAILYYNAAELSKAKENALLSLKLKAAADTPYVILGLIYLRQNDKVAARKEFEEALAVNPQNSVAKEQLAILTKNAF